MTDLSASRKRKAATPEQVPALKKQDTKKEQTVPDGSAVAVPMIVCQRPAAERFTASITLLGGRLVGTYKKATEKVHCLCGCGHDCYPSPHNIKRGDGMCRKCAGRCPEESEKAFRDSVAAMGGRVVGKYTRARDGVHCTCANGHDCYPSPSGIKRGDGMCRKCTGNCPEEAETAFRDSICAKGGRVVGKYSGTHDGVHCICANGHDCYPAPNSIKQGRGMCRKCASRCPEETEKAFRASIASKGGRVIGEYIGTHEGVHCICTNGHACFPAPAYIQKGQGMCLKCAGLCPEEAEKAFRASITAKGGRVIGEYARNAVEVHCICANGHDCYPSPANIQHGQGMCRKCAGNCPEESERAFRDSITAIGGRVIGEYIRSKDGVHCVCPNGHDCCPAPTHIRYGVGMCLKCAPSSYGELATINALELLGLDFEREFRFKPDKRRYDFCIENHHVMIEFDGQQHFQAGGLLIKTEEDLLVNQENDRQKQTLALSRGFRMMRFDYGWAKADPAKMAEKIHWFIHKCTDSVWVSNPELYEWLFLKGLVPLQ